MQSNVWLFVYIQLIIKLFISNFSIFDQISKRNTAKVPFLQHLSIPYVILDTPSMYKNHEQHILNGINIEIVYEYTLPTFRIKLQGRKWFLLLVFLYCASTHSTVRLLYSLASAIFVLNFNILILLFFLASLSKYSYI